MRLIALDVGERRIGVAKADSSVKIAVPAGAVSVNGREIDHITRYITVNNIDIVVVGMPRNLKGEQTKQSEYVKDFVKNLNKTLTLKKPNNKTIKIFFQDESLTSVQAKNNLRNKKGGVNKKAGDIDAEAATLILQDFLENLTKRLTNRDSSPETPQIDQTTPKMPENYPLEAPRSVVPKKADKDEGSAQKPLKTPQKPQFEPYKNNSAKKWAMVRALIIVFIMLGVGVFSGISWYKNITSPLVAPEKCTGSEISKNAELCASKEVNIPEGTSLTGIANLLKENGVIKSSLGFKMYAKVNGSAEDLKAGRYSFTPDSELADILKILKEGTNENIVFRLTILPGETMKDVKKRLMSVGYKETEIDAAFTKNYNHPVLADKPDDASIEGYLFGETYEFYTSDSVETIVIRMLDELYSVVQKNNLKQKYNNMGLTLHEGIILASIVQKEAGTLSKEDMSTVAQVFINRLNQGMALGSDVTVKYAVDLVDPDRKTYTDNASALEIESCYNTRKYSGLPCGPISNPGALTLISTANPSDTSYLYFLTGDDGLMYYSNTESEHNQNIVSHCQKLCNVSL